MLRQVYNVGFEIAHEANVATRCNIELDKLATYAMRDWHRVRKVLGLSQKRLRRLAKRFAPSSKHVVPLGAKCRVTWRAISGPKMINLR